MISWSEAKSEGMTREKWSSLMSKKKRKAPVKRRFVRDLYSCHYRGGIVGKTPCKTCGSKTGFADLHECKLHGVCTVRKLTKKPLCQTCPDRINAKNAVDFSGFKNSHSGECYVFGSGKTDFNYNTISTIKQPMFFINQAAQLADKRPAGENYMFALDKKMKMYYEKFPGTLVLTKNQNTVDAMGAVPDAFRSAERICWFRNGVKDRIGMPFGRDYLETDRERLSVDQMLYQGLHGTSATIMPLLHFVWFCGFTKVNMVGCDGLPNGYDPRLENRTEQRDRLNADPEGIRFTRFRLKQDEISATLGLDLQYL